MLKNFNIEEFNEFPLKETFGFIEADGYGRLKLYFEFKEDGYFVEEYSKGLIINIGDFNNMPINLNIFWMKVNDIYIGFWNCCSLVVHHGMIKEWFEKYMSHVKANYDSQNAHNTLKTLNIKPKPEYVYFKTLDYIENEHKFRKEQLSKIILNSEYKEQYLRQQKEISKRAN